MVKCNSSLQRTCFHCTRVQWRWALHHSSQSLALCIGILGLCVAARAWKPIVMKLPMNSFCANFASRGSLGLGSEFQTASGSNRGQTIFTRCALQHPLCVLPLHGWAIVDPRSFHFTITALTVNQDSSSRAGIWQVASYDSDILKVTELFSKAILLPMFVYGDCMAVYSIIYTCQQRVAEIVESTHLKGCPYIL